MFTPFQKRIVLLAGVALVVTIVFVSLVERSLDPLPNAGTWIGLGLWVVLLVLMNRVWHVIPTPEDGDGAGRAFIQSHGWSRLELVTYRRALSQYLAAEFESTDQPKVRLMATDDRAGVLWSYYTYAGPGAAWDGTNVFSVWRFDRAQSIGGEVWLTTTVHPWPLPAGHLPEQQQERIVRRRFDSPMTAARPVVQRLVGWYQALGRHPAVWVKGRQVTVVFAGIPTGGDLEHQYRLVQALQKLGAN